ncbi:MAG TPA: hydrogenase maturation protease [Acidobacteriaceae bacterium]
MATLTPQSAGQTGRALLLACGNCFRGDDGVGWRIGSAVERTPPRPDLTVVMTHQLLPEHAEAISSADVVVFVDCSAISTAGTVSTIPIQPAETLPRILTHHLDPASLLKLALDLYERVPANATVITVGGESFELTDRLTTTVKAAVPKALEAVRCALLAGPSLAQ